MTNDGATILSLLDIEHPSGKILVDLAQQQDKEVGSKFYQGTARNIHSNQKHRLVMAPHLLS